MYFSQELFLTKSYIDENEWLHLIKVISNYNGLFKKWKIIVSINNNTITFFIKSKCILPTTINSLNSFMIKSIDNITLPKPNRILPFQTKLNNNIVDLINYAEIKNKGNLKYIEITFIKITKQKIKSKVSFYINKNNKIINYNILYYFPAKMLSIDFEGNKRYFYKNTPKYLDISKTLHLLNTDATNALFSIDTFPYLQETFYLNQNNFSFDKHSIIMGSSGCGKSKFISMFINNIYKNDYLRENYKVVVVDPHAALADDIGEIGKVVDFINEYDNINLFNNENEDIISSTELLLDLFKTLIQDQYNSKLERILRYSIHLLLVNKSFNFKNLKKIILDLDYRNNLINAFKNNLPISVIDFFLSDFNELKTKSYNEAISPIISFIDELDLIPIFNNEDNNENLESTIRKNFLTLFSLDRTKLGQTATKTITGLISEQIMTIIQKRKINKHIILIIDEIAIIENPIIPKLLSESRKYNLSLILAGQYFNQISEELKDSIFANVINYFIFRVSKQDAESLVNNIDMKIPLDNTREQKIKMLTELANRECIVRCEQNGMLYPALKAKTLDYISRPRIIKNTNININKNITNIKSNRNINFKLDTNISLNDILLSNSTKKGCKQ